ncbi:LysR family transcriptional regulator [Leptolyngbya sp. FACHB-16]|nr:LysR family transcriptional regulator [Leptolyngbya sp. FACHB-8]MBD2156553.1 LysR family transcriptional regulator [Leptolyngbya sp. FACHB-16]
MTLSQLQTLLAVAERSSFSDAALQLGLSQSSVSGAIAMLEEQLGVVLFSRGRYGAHLTPIGERMVAYAQQIVKLQEDMFTEARLSNSLRGGDLRITSFRSVTTHILSNVLARFRQQFPNVAIRISDNWNNQVIEEDLRRGRADVGFIDSPLGDEFEKWKVFEDEYVVLIPMPFQHPGVTLTWEQLSRYPLIMFAEGDMHDEEVYAHCEAHGVTLNVDYYVNADSSIVSMMAQGLGVTIMPRLAAEPIPENVQVYSLPVPLYREIWMAVLASALLSPPVFAFLDMVKAQGMFKK